MTSITKSLCVAASTLALASIASASVTFTGVAVKNGTNISVGDVAVFIVDETGLGFSSIDLSFNSSITDSNSYGSNFTVIGSVTAASFLGINVGSPAAFSLGNGVDTGDRFAVVVFSSSTSSAIAGDTYTIWTDTTWVVPADSATVSFANPANGGFLQLASTTAAFTKTVQGSAVPEPSTAAALSGLAILGFAASRRKRRAA